jgi:hypothetical protein
MQHIDNETEFDFDNLIEDEETQNALTKLIVFTIEGSPLPLKDLR